MLKRSFDLVFSIIGLFLLTPLFLVLALLILIEDGHGCFFKQERVGLYRKMFYIYKFRTMRPNSEKYGLLTVGAKDKRVTKFGYYLRKFKLDELPQLYNVLIGDMSFVGPRPEVPKYVNEYSDIQLRVLMVKPGITDPASIYFRNENDLLSNSVLPEEFYLKVIMPKKLSINLEYIDNDSFFGDIFIITSTLRKLFIG